MIVQFLTTKDNKITIENIEVEHRTPFFTFIHPSFLKIGYFIAPGTVGTKSAFRRSVCVCVCCI